MKAICGKCGRTFEKTGPMAHLVAAHKSRHEKNCKGRGQPETEKPMPVPAPLGQDLISDNTGDNDEGISYFLVTNGPPTKEDLDYAYKTWAGMYQGGDAALQAACGGFDSPPVHQNSQGDSSNSKTSVSKTEVEGASPSPSANRLRSTPASMPACHAGETGAAPVVAAIRDGSVSRPTHLTLTQETTGSTPVHPTNISRPGVAETDKRGSEKPETRMQAPSPGPTPTGVMEASHPTKVEAPRSSRGSETNLPTVVQQPESPPLKRTDEGANPSGGTNNPQARSTTASMTGSDPVDLGSNPSGPAISCKHPATTADSLYCPRCYTNLVDRVKLPVLWRAVEGGLIPVRQERDKWAEHYEAAKHGDDARADRILRKLCGIKGEPMSEEKKEELRQWKEDHAEEIAQRKANKEFEERRRAALMENRKK